ncbi:uncharacterized protein UTRI_03475 [Ustilago trichophora]|uniref:F-box domain-containing protein n=1 Tax=Ustilago trichophora TaxID=86804 RepID=A0A5C3E3M9_9BASI|nr:uncharacterized protein UTRI_03475 [Ustilago trichophora]
MGRYQALKEPSTSCLVHKPAHKPPPPPLFRLPTDVWLHIFAQLCQNLSQDGLSTLSALSLTSKYALKLVDEYGWKYLLQAQYKLVSIQSLDAYYSEYVQTERAGGGMGGESVRSKWWFACRYACLLQSCWDAAVLCSGTMEIPAPLKAKKNVGRGRRFGGDFAIPTLVVGTRWLIVGVRSELFLYPSRPTERAKLGGQCVARIKLDSRSATELGLAMGREKEKTPDDPWQDITALKAINEETSKVVVGFADGGVQVLSINLVKVGKVDKVQVEVLHHLPSSRRSEVADVSIRTTPQQQHLIASLSKRGLLQIHTVPYSTALQTHSWSIDTDGIAIPSSQLPTSANSSSGTNTPPPRPAFRSAAFNNAPLVHPDESSVAGGGAATRAWSVLLGPTWVAVGMTGEHAVYLYPFTRSESGMELKEPYYVANTGQHTSVYAMATASAGSNIPEFLLFAGFYDGVVRVYDTRQLHTEPDAMDMQDLNEALSPLLNGNYQRRRRRVRKELDPIAIFREDYDTDAIYSLTFAGPQSNLLIVGGARHSKVRIFDVSSLREYDVPLLSAPAGVQGRKKGAEEERGDWTAFALANTDSPQYGVVGNADRIIGVTDRKLWWFDFGLPLLERDVERDEDAGKVAFFRHRDGVLSYSSSTLHSSHGPA